MAAEHAPGTHALAGSSRLSLYAKTLTAAASHAVAPSPMTTAGFQRHGSAATGGGACRRRRFASRSVPGSRIVAPWAAAGAASASLSLMSGAGACGEASSSLLSSKVMGGIESSSAACGGGSRAAVEAAESALRRF